MLLNHVYFVLLFTLPLISSHISELDSDSPSTLQRVRRIAARKHHKHRKGTKRPVEIDPWGSVVEVSTEVPAPASKESEEMDYPEGYFIRPGVTDAPETVYDYPQEKFNRSYLTGAEWRPEITNKTRRYKVSNKKGPHSFLLPDIEPPTPIKGVLGIW